MIASRMGAPLPPSLAEFRAVGVAAAREALASEEYELFLVNYRPDAPSLGTAAGIQWRRACEEIVTAQSERLRVSSAVRRSPMPSLTSGCYLTGHVPVSLASAI